MQEQIFAGEDGDQLTGEWDHESFIEKFGAYNKLFEYPELFAAKNRENVARDQLL